MRIATWNLERPRARQEEKLSVIQTQLESVDADIWILTETNSCVSPGADYQGVQSEVMTSPERYWPGENRTTIWSRFPVKKEVQTHDPDTAVCAEIDCGGRMFLIYGTVLPYHAAGTNYAYRSMGQTVSGRKAWQLHYEAIAAHEKEWKQLRGKYPSHAFIVGGDLNQNRDGRRWYGTNHGRERLGSALRSAGLVCTTEGPVETENGETLDPCIDHICLDTVLQDRRPRVFGWVPGVKKNGKPVSDHNGVCVVLPD